MRASPRTVMVVEDEIVLQDVYKLVLEKNGYTVVTANNGLEALTRIKHAKPDVVLLDMLMPVMSGREFMLNLKTDLYPDLRIIVCSNLSDREAEEEMLQLGAERFILKSSMNPSDLIQLIEPT